ncbi:hypothetical protein [Chroococcidiopsis sp.]|uniref:hypothetical protein n=1 Tax=Chroococcidiopsis sp. TaxID=3088168 RepID=UPI003F2C898E
MAKRQKLPTTLLRAFAPVSLTADFATKIFFSTADRSILLALSRAIYDSTARCYNLCYVFVQLPR